MIRPLSAPLVLGLVVGCIAAEPPDADSVPIRVSGKIHEDADLSGIELFGDRLLVISDEDGRIQVLEPDGPDSYRARPTAIPLRDDPETELDLEGIAVAVGRVFVVGSHSLRRKRLKPHKSYASNRERLAEVDRPQARFALFRVTIDPETLTAERIESVDLGDLLRADPVFGRFGAIPGHENGINIEGLAVERGRVVIGLRGPVLRSKLVPVLTLDFDDPDEYTTRYVNLDGRGIRAMDRVAGGYLLLAGDERTGDVMLFFWDGRDQLPGKDRDTRPCAKLASIPSPADAVAEGLTVVSESATSYDVIVVHDGVAGGFPERLRIAKPD
jgi:hypothetical protein